MTGKKGCSGGRREGSGRKPTPPSANAEVDPLEFLLHVMQGLIVPSPAQLKAAETAARLIHGSAKPQGKKEQREAAAKQAGEGRFKAVTAPRLASVDGKTVTDAA